MSTGLTTGEVLRLLQDVAAEVITPRFRSLSGDQITEKNPGDLVTVADREAEVRITAALQHAYPDALVLGEEATASDDSVEERFRQADHAFTVDPVDGTKNFVAGSPLHAVMAAELRDGEYRYGLTIDGFDRPVEIRAAVHVHGDELTVDFAGSSGPVPLGVNVALNYTRAYTTYGIKCLISPDVPNNEGSFRPVHVLAPEGSLLNPRFPAAVSNRLNVHVRFFDCMSGAMGQRAPDLAMAAGYGASPYFVFSGTDEHDRYFQFVELLFGGFALYNLVLLPAWGSNDFPAGHLPLRVMSQLNWIVIAALTAAFGGNWRGASSTARAG